MADEFSEIDLNDNVPPVESIESSSNHRTHRKKTSSSIKSFTSSTSQPSSLSPPLYLNSPLHELNSPLPTLSILDNTNSIPLSFPTPSSGTRYSSTSSIPSPPSLITSSESSPKNSISRSVASTDLTKSAFNFPILRHDSIIDSLLSAIYERDGSTYGFSSSQDSDTITGGDLTDRSISMHRSSDDSMVNENQPAYSKSNLANKSIQELRHLCTHMQQQTNQANALLVKNLRHRDKNLSKLQRNCDIITAILQAASPKRREDTTMRFSLTPYPGEKGFQQWKDAISVATRMPGGIPPAIRQKLWISLASNYIREIRLDWDKTCRFAFNNCSNPDDDQLGIQIVKDLHRTGCSWSSNEHDRATLKRVLLAFARYNKSIGYCQGLNILAGVILDVVDMNEEYAFMILIYLIDNILPNFFANNLRDLAIDMAVFREWLRIYNAKLHQHLQCLQSSSHDASGTIYEPPLLNVFTIQWFLTLFATCLPRRATLRVWDVLMIEGSEILFRTGLILWSKLAITILKVTTADQFYSAMAQVSVQLLDEKIIDADNLIKEIYNMGPFPTPLLSELRQKFSFNITPFQQLSSSTANTTDESKAQQTHQQKNIDRMKLRNKKRSKTKTGANNEDETPVDEEIANVVSCFALLSSSSSKAGRPEYYQNEFSIANNPAALSRLTPGAYSNLPTTHKTNSIEDSLSLDISQLRQQYKKLKERNKQVHVIIQTASNEQKQRSRTSSIHPSPSNNTDSFRRSTSSLQETASPGLPSSVCSMTGDPLVNHLLIKPTDVKRNQLKKSISIKTSTPTPVQERQPPIVVRPVVTESIPEEKFRQSKEQEAEDAAELRQELDQLLTSLNLEKPPPTPSTKISEQQPEVKSSGDGTGPLRNVAQTLYNYEKNQVTPSDNKEASNLIDRLLTSHSVQVPKYSSFNPFPSRSFNENVAMNGYKLGLYAPDPTNH